MTLGNDLALEGVQAALRPIYRVLEHTHLARDEGHTLRRVDFASANGRDNLSQAIVARLLTPRGELAALGHASYGCRLHSLIGSRNTPGNRDRARLYILESLAQEPRLKDIEFLDVATKPGTRDTLVIRLRVVAIGSDDPIDLGPFDLELES